MNSLVWVGQAEILGGARFSMSATIPLANNSLSSSGAGAISGGGGLGDSYFQPFILGWNFERVAVRAVYGFLAPTGSFEPGTNTNVGIGVLDQRRRLGTDVASHLQRCNHAVGVPDVRVPQRSSRARASIPAQTLDLDYSLTHTLSLGSEAGLQVGLIGYGAWQMTGKTGPGVSLDEQRARYSVNAIGFATSVVWPRRRVSLGSQVLQGVRKPLDLSGLLHPDFRLGWFLRQLKSSSRAPGRSVRHGAPATNWPPQPPRGARPRPPRA